ncbi:RNA polymerase sigma factor [Oryzobacter telluris]|uniref:RNA polymerase sigma factor n=1 Tax=Oryzobacter telluris TaxID=3149179 RepID=UPI00370D93EB
MTDEDELIARARTGDAAAFAALLDPHRARLWSVCVRITGSHHDAEDALQDALTVAWLHLDRFRGESRLGTWLYRIAANAALAVVRRRRDVPRGEWADDLVVTSDHASRVADGMLVRGGIASLPPVFREALVLREIGDLTYEEIAAHQGVGVQTVKSRLSRARAALAVALTSGDDDR